MTSLPAELAATALGLAAALGGGLLIGLERERRKGRGAQREAAGIRSFALAALGGGIAQSLQQAALVVLGGALVAVLVAVAYWKSRDGSALAPGSAAPDPGLTTELALFVTYLVGVLSVQQPVLGAAAAAAVAALLAAREKLHRLATEVMTEAEVHDALLLAALVLVLLPLAPSTPVAWLGGLVPRTLLLTALLILALQAAGHVALRLLGARAGLALSGLFSGFVSSTATIASMGARARAQGSAARASGEPFTADETASAAAPEDERAACTAGALFSTVATWVQMLMLVGTLAPGALPGLLPAALAGAAVAAAVALLQWRVVPAGPPSTAAAARSAQTAGTAGTIAAPAMDAAAETSRPPKPGTVAGPLRLREALLVSAALAAVSLLVGWAQRQFGNSGLLAGTALAALADAHAPVAALAGLQAAGQVDSRTLLQGVLLAAAANGLTRAVTAFVAGGPAFGIRLAGSLALSTAAAAGVARAWGLR